MRRLAQDEYELDVWQMSVDALGGTRAFQVIGALFAGGGIVACLAKPRVVVMLDSECIQLVYQKELWFRSSRFGHVHVRVPVEQFVQPRRAGARRAGNDEGWALSWHVREDKSSLAVVAGRATLRKTGEPIQPVHAGGGQIVPGQNAEAKA